MWQGNLQGWRTNQGEHVITPGNVRKLQLRWAWAFPGADAASSQPAVVGDTLYVGGRDGKLYALNAQTGAERWSFDISGIAGGVPTVLPDQGLFGGAPYFGNTSTTAGIRDGPAVAGGAVFFGDNRANVYALNAQTGGLLWHTKVDDFQDAIITGSPVVFRGRVIVGVSSGEEAFGLFPAYSCCHFRGSVVALDERTGKLDWKYYTAPVPQAAGTNPYGAARYNGAGVSVWASPVLDPASDTVYDGTANNYSGSTPMEDSMLALDGATGHLKWDFQLTRNDAWTIDCSTDNGAAGNCPQPGPDWDFGASGQLFTIPRKPLRRVVRVRRVQLVRRDGRRVREVRTVERVRYTRRRPELVFGEGQKSGIYHVLDARTGRSIWNEELSIPHGAGGPNFQQGVQWGSSYDGHHLFVSTAVANPGGLFELDPRTGHILWRSLAPANGCSTGGATNSSGCEIGYPAAASSIPGVVFLGGLDGKFRAFSSATGKVLWSYDTVKSYITPNGQGNGGSVSGGGATIAHGMVYVNSGYNTEDAPSTGMNGNVLLAFGLPAAAPGSPRAAAAAFPLAGVITPDGAMNLGRCVAAFDQPYNEKQWAQVTAPHSLSGAPITLHAYMDSDGEHCMLDVALSAPTLLGGHRHFGNTDVIQETMRAGGRFLPGSNDYVLPKQPPDRWDNVTILPSGRLVVSS